MFNFTNKISFNGFKLLIPSVGVGNVAQLSADLFIETLKMKKVAMVSVIWNLFTGICLFHNCC